MKEKSLIPISIITALLIGFIFIIELNESKYINIEEDNLMWNLYELNISKIEENMSEITEPNEIFEWWEFKDFDIEDTYYKNMLNNLLIDIRTRYLELTDEDEMYTDSNPIRKYRDTNKVTKEDLELLIWKNNNISNIESIYRQYKGYVISENEDNSSIFTNKLDELEESHKKLYIENPTTYNNLLYNELVETNELIELSEFLKSEYNRLK